MQWEDGRPRTHGIIIGHGSEDHNGRCYNISDQDQTHDHKNENACKGHPNFHRRLSQNEFHRRLPQKWNV